MPVVSSELSEDWHTCIPELRPIGKEKKKKDKIKDQSMGRMRLSSVTGYSNVDHSSLIRVYLVHGHFCIVSWTL